MKVAELAVWAIVAWSAIGLVGVTVSSRHGEHAKVRRGLFWIVAVWIAYLAVLLTVSRVTPRRHLNLGQDQCFGTVCYAAVAAEELPGFAARCPSGYSPRERLLRVSVRVLNHAPAGIAAQPRVRAYLLDAQGRSWPSVPGLTGVRLTAPMVAGHAVVSQPVFRVPDNASGFSLVLTKGPWQPGLLEIGNPDSWMHAPTLLDLGR
jgi:hypothetical protein